MADPLVDLEVGEPGPIEVDVESARAGDRERATLGASTPGAPSTPAVLVFVDEAQVRRLLRSLGGGLGYVVGDDDVPGHWRFSDDELNDLAPPLVSIINRTPKLLQVVARGDELAAGLALGEYVGRNIKLAREAQRDREDRDGEAGGAEAPDRADAGGGVRVDGDVGPLRPGGDPRAGGGLG